MVAWDSIIKEEALSMSQKYESVPEKESKPVRVLLESIIAKVRPDVYVKGGDYTLGTLPEAKIVQSYGGRVEFVDLVAGRSTTNVIEKIREEMKGQRG